VTIIAARDFSLNTDDWFHTNRDPRQLVNFEPLRALVFHADGTPDIELFASAADVHSTVSAINPTPTTLDAQIHVNKSKIWRRADRDTARFLDINGVVQSGVQTVAMTIARHFVAQSTGSLVDDDGHAVAGVTFGDDCR